MKKKLLFSMKAYDCDSGEVFSGQRIEIGDLTPRVLGLWKNWGAISFRIIGKEAEIKIDKQDTM